MKRVIIESPYAGNIERNMEYARRCIADAISRHEAPFLSHVLYAHTGALDDSDPDQRALGITAGTAWIECAEFTAAYTDYGISPGMQLGINFAIAKGKLIQFRKIGENPE